MSNQDLLVPETKSIDYVDPAAVAAAETAKARIQSAYVMAYRKPRNEDQSRVRILEACKRPGFAERVEYAKPVGNRSITGPSVRFAELALREWGNILTESQLIYEDTEIRRVRVTVIDLETNATFSKELSIRKTVERKQAADREVIGKRLNTKKELVFIVLATEDELHNKEAAMISKALRNEGLRVIPTDIIDEAMETAKATLRNRDAQDPKAAKKRVIDGFAGMGIKPKDLEVYLKHSLDTVSPAELETLRGVYAALKEGDATWADYVQTKPEAEVQKDEGKTATEKLAEKTRQKPGPKPKGEPGKAGPEPPSGPDNCGPPPGNDPPILKGIGAPPRCGEVFDEVTALCAEMQLNTENMAGEYSADKIKNLAMLTLPEGEKLLSYLVDLKAKREEEKSKA